jgi:hypothetical protein
MQRARTRHTSLTGHLAAEFPTTGTSIKYMFASFEDQFLPFKVFGG